MTATEYVFRHAGGCLIDFPDLDIHRTVHGAPWRWIATVWPDTLRPGGWAALEWLPGERGWEVPASLAVGDVVEFGVAGFDDAAGSCTLARRWFGWLTHATDRALVVTGPYATPAKTHAAATPVIDEVRLAQLIGPAVPSSEVSEWDRAADEA
ncbi:MAG: hypothetical protein AAB131_09035 [Actinomycetota bacterium]